MNSVATVPPANGGAQSTPTAANVVRNMVDPHVLSRGRVVCIGLGGIGLYLVRAALTFITGLLQGSQKNNEELSIDVLLCDGDSFTPENTYRMDIPEFGNKAVVIGQESLERFDSPGLVIRWKPQFVNEENVADIIRDGDCVLLACDNHDTRNLVGRRCADESLTNVVLISGGNDGVENGLRGTYGNVQIYWKENGENLTAPIQQFHPEIANPADQSPHKQSCIEQAAAGAPQLTFANMAVASAMCNALLRLMTATPDERMYDETALDILDARMVPHWLSGPQEI